MSKELEKQVHVSSPTALREAFKAELKRRTIAKSSG